MKREKVFFSLNRAKGERDESWWELPGGAPWMRPEVWCAPLSSSLQTVGWWDHRSGRHPHGSGPEPQRGAQRARAEDAFRSVPDVAAATAEAHTRLPGGGTCAVFRPVSVFGVVSWETKNTHKKKNTITSCERMDTEHFCTNKYCCALTVTVVG